jgi:multisubunit Na+/H+ antiporter MnhG subunit
MAAHGAIIVLVLLVGLLAPLGLYYLVRAEHDEREEMSREEAERAARRDVDDDR